MLNCTQDRLDYGRLLAPPAGYELARAVAATYSLDLSLLLSVPVALSFSGPLKEYEEADVFALLESVRRCMGRIRVYCQKGRIQVPTSHSALYALVEDSVVQVRMDSAFRSFHPKVWVLRYEDAKALPFYRVIVLSRNLTGDRDWDLAVHLDGEIGDRPDAANQPLVDFLHYLQTFATEPENESFLADLTKVSFERVEGFQRNVRFHPTGIPGYERSPIAGQSGNSLLVMSPFVDAATLGVLRQQVAADRHLFSRREELDRLPREALEGFACQVLSDLVVEGERRADEDGSAAAALAQQLHAKLFLYQRPGGCRWFVGSANATAAAQGAKADGTLGVPRNVEFMLELRNSTSGGNIQPVLEDLLRAHEGVFEDYVRDGTAEDAEDAAAAQLREHMRRLEYELTGDGVFSGLLQVCDETGSYDLHVTTDLSAVISGLVAVRIAPFNIDCDTQELTLGGRGTIVFGGINTESVSRFLCVELVPLAAAGVRRFLVKIAIEGIPAERDDAVFRSIVRDADAFLRYIRLLLADDDGWNSPSGDPWGTGDGLAEVRRALTAEKPLFEELLRAASRQPRSLKTIDGVVRKLEGTVDAGGCPLVPEDFMALWAAFRRYGVSDSESDDE